MILSQQILAQIHPNPSKSIQLTPVNPLRISAFADLSEHNGNPTVTHDPRPGGLGDRRLALRACLQETQRPSAGHQRSAARGGAGSRTLFIGLEWLFGMGFSSGLMVIFHGGLTVVYIMINGDLMGFNSGLIWFNGDSMVI